MSYDPQNDELFSLTQYGRNVNARIQQASAKLLNVFVKALLWC